jgi:L-histidine N-alpha-methyltransferase
MSTSKCAHIDAVTQAESVSPCDVRVFSYPGQRLRLFETPTQLESFASNVRDGLSVQPKRLSSAYLYDAVGSLLFEEICKLDEYYVTRAESEILQREASKIAQLFSKDTVVVELGSGSSTKTRYLISAFIDFHQALHYIPIDISPTILKESAEALLQSFPSLQITGVIAEYCDALKLLKQLTGEQTNKLIVWLGSSVGNFNRSEARQFLTRIRETLNPSDCVLIGIDLKKDTQALLSAYNDSKGVTEQFIKNILTRINRELHGEFDVDSFQYNVIYNEAEGAVEMHLCSTHRQTVTIRDLDLSLHFQQGETIHVESSYKYAQRDIEELVTASGFCLQRQWFDSLSWFSLNLLSVSSV